MHDVDHFLHHQERDDPRQNTQTHTVALAVVVRVLVSVRVAMVVMGVLMMMMGGVHMCDGFAEAMEGAFS